MLLQKAAAQSPTDEAAQHRNANQHKDNLGGGKRIHGGGILGAVILGAGDQEGVLCQHNGPKGPHVGTGKNAVANAVHLFGLVFSRPGNQLRNQPQQ